MGDSSGESRLLIVAGWVLSFLAPFAGIVGRHHGGKPAAIALLLLSALMLSWGRGRRWEYPVDVLVESVLPAIIAMTVLWGLALVRKPTWAGGIVVVGHVAAIAVVVHGFRSRRKRAAEQKEWEAAMDTKLAALPPEKALRFLHEETETALANSKRILRRAAWLIGVVAVLGAVLVFLSLRLR